jgi:dipeptidyl aminopeptidase/acylaminoacyl peptidase
LYATNEYKIALWDLAANKPGRTFFTGAAPDSSYYPDVAVAADGLSLAAVVDDKLYVWDPAGKILLQAPAYKLMISAGLEYSTDGSRLTVFSPGHTGIDIYETNNWTLIRRVPHDQISNVAISPDGQIVAATNRKDDTVSVWDVNTGEQLAHLDPGNWAESIQFNPTGDMLMIAGMGNLDTQDSYSNLGTLYETQTWTKVDTLYSFLGYGDIEFNEDGSRMAVFGFMGPEIWGPPDDKLKEGFEVVKQFQTALSSGDYALAASMFEVNAGEEETLTNMGFDLTDLPASFERLCNSREIFCLPVHDLVMMGNDFEAMIYLVRLEDSNGEVFTSPKGAHIINFYLYTNADGLPRVSYPPMD